MSFRNLGKKLQFSIASGLDKLTSLAANRPPDDFHQEFAYLHLLPDEIIQSIAEFLDNSSHISNLAKSCRRFHGALDLVLYRRYPSHALLWAAKTRQNEGDGFDLIIARKVLSVLHVAHPLVANLELEALRVAALNDNREVAGLLLDHIPDASWILFRGITPPSYEPGDSAWAIRRVLKSVELLRRFVPVYPRSREGISGTAPQLACCTGAGKEVLNVFLERGLDVTGEIGYLLLINAASDTHPTSVQLLLRHGAKPDWKPQSQSQQQQQQQQQQKKKKKQHDAIGQPDLGLYTPIMGSPLLVSVNSRRWENVRLLLQAGVSPTDPGLNSSGFCRAIFPGRLDIARLMLDTREDNVLSHNRSALYLAAYGGHTEIARLLLDSGCRADSTLREDDALLEATSGLAEASAAGHEDMVRLLLDKWPSEIRGSRECEMAFRRAIKARHESIVRFFIERGVDPQCGDRKGLKFDPELPAL